MAVYKRYNTRRRKLSRKIIIPLICMAVVFLFTVLLGNYLGNKAKGAEPQYTGQVFENGDGVGLAPLSEKSLHGIYVSPDELSKFTSDDEDTWASTWIYRDGKATFATALDEKLGDSTKKKPTLDAFDIESGTIGLFEVSCLSAEDSVKGIVTEYEKALISEFALSGLDEIVLVFYGISEDNYRPMLEFADSVVGAKVICVPYSMLESQEFFSAAAEKGVGIALMADDVTDEQLEADIEKYAFYFTKYNLRLVLSSKDKDLVEVLSKHALLNYQFYS